MSTRDLFLARVSEEIRRIERLTLELQQADEEVLEVALKVMGGPGMAVSWLMNQRTEFNYLCPLEILGTYCGRDLVIQLLRQIEERD